MEARRTARKKETSVAQPAPIELTLVATFSSPWKDKQAEVEAIIEGRWHPATADFSAVARTPNVAVSNATVLRDVDSVSSFIGAITCVDTRGERPRRNRSISRVNIITHGGPGCIALKGAVFADRRVTLGKAGERHILDEMIDERIVEWFNTDPVGRIHRDAIRDKLTPDAELWLVLCNGGCVGPSANLAWQLADTFGITVRGYKDEVRYWPDYMPESPASGIFCPRIANMATRSKTATLPAGRHNVQADPRACVAGRNTTSIGIPKGDEEAWKRLLGRGYFCKVKVDDAFAGKHMAGAEKFGMRKLAE